MGLKQTPLEDSQRRKNRSVPGPFADAPCFPDHTLEVSLNRRRCIRIQTLPGLEP